MKKPRILIVSFVPKLLHKLQPKFPHLELDLYDVEGRAADPGKPDLVVVSLAATSHQQTERLKSRLPGGVPIMFTHARGTSSLANALREHPVCAVGVRPTP